MRKPGSKVELKNPLGYLAQAYVAGRVDLCLDVLTNIYVYLMRKLSSSSLRREWKQELGFNSKFHQKLRRYGLPVFRFLDFIIKKIGNDRCYHVRIDTNTNGSVECYLAYSSGPMNVRSNDRIAKRGCQLKRDFSDSTSLKKVRPWKKNREKKLITEKRSGLIPPLNPFEEMNVFVWTVIIWSRGNPTIVTSHRLSIKFVL